jgi:sensor histidine kinase regulating citrate/malate metabolism
VHQFILLEGGVRMVRFLENWNYKKHAVAVSGFYLGIAVLGNALLGKKIPKDEKSLNPVNICRHMTMKQRIFNGIVTGMYTIDMSLTYCIINHFKKQFK